MIPTLIHRNRFPSKSSLLLLLFVLCCIRSQTTAEEEDPPSPPTESTSSTSSSIGELESEIGYYQSISIEKVIYPKTKSKYQDIEIYRTKHFGNTLVLDGAVQITEGDADSYNEMMAHVPMFQHENPKRILILGGGDGYVLHEVLKHQTVVHVDHVELDNEMIQVCRDHFQWGKYAWNDPRVQLHIQDGYNFVQNAAAASYDVIIQDSSDPWDEMDQNLLPSSVLFTLEHFQHIHRILKPHGIFNFQAESINLPSYLGGIKLWRQQALQVGFSKARYGSIGIPTYPTGQIGMMLCEKDPSVASSSTDIQQRWQLMMGNKLETTYYHPPLQQSCFDVVPYWAKKVIYDMKEDDNNCDLASAWAGSLL